MHFTFFDCQIIEGKLQKKVHRDIRWVRAEELEQYEFCTADVEVAERLRKVSNDDA
jgi:8-oxo-dGTP diphosphatase